MNKVSINKLIKLIFFMSLFVFTSLNFNATKTLSAYAKPNYAQIKNSNTYLYKSTSDDTTSNRWCLIEKSYFVKILNNYNSEFYKVEYNGITGFIKKSEICLVNEIPLVPYPSNIKFSTNSTNCYLRSSPQIKDVTDNTLSVIPSNTQNLKYIGKIIGEEAIDFKGSIWYLTEYNGIKGYVYSAYTTSITPVSENIEKVTQFNGNDFSRINPLTNKNCILIITFTLLPCALILFLLYAPKKSKHIAAKQNSTKPSTEDISNFYDENL